MNQQPAFERSWRTKATYLYLTRNDADDLSASFRDASPNVKFVSMEPEMRFVDRDRWRREVNDEHARRERGESAPTVKYHSRDPGTEPLDSLQSLSDIRAWRFYAWVEPPGWRPLWKLKIRANTGSPISPSTRPNYG